MRLSLVAAACVFLQSGFGLLYGQDATAPRLVTITALDSDGTATKLQGRILLDAQDGSLMFEERCGRIHLLKPAEFRDSVTSETAFSFLSDDERAAKLLTQTGAGFAIHQSKYFLLCSDASELYTAFCGRLLDKVMEEYLRFFADSEVSLVTPPGRLPVLIFRDNATFQAFARQQHPETDFSDVPGYYSIRDNQMLICGISGDRQFRTNSDVVRELKKRPRQVETIVHEAVHQLAFNTGLQVRYADNPLWFSEGLAVYFESSSGRGPLVWSRPGTSNRIHLPTLKTAVGRDGRFGLPLHDLLSSDAAFQSSENLANAYAESWALTHFLITRHRQAFDQFALGLRDYRPREPVSAETRLQRIATATNCSIGDLEQDLIRHISRLRLPR